jgi:hypothetical protein
MHSNWVLLWPLLGGVILGFIVRLKIILALFAIIFLLALAGIAVSAFFAAPGITTLFGVAAMGMGMFGGPALAGIFVGSALRRLMTGREFNE